METFSGLKDTLLKELKIALDEVSEDEVNAFIDAVQCADKVFFIGAGRVLLISQTFAKRLIHLRIKSYVVGETTTPNIQRGDLLVASSGSGETMTTVSIAKQAKKQGAKIALPTANPSSTLGKIADLSVRIPCPTKLHLKGECSSMQAMTNLFEQSLLLFFDCVSIMIQRRLGLTEEQLWEIHANLE